MSSQATTSSFVYIPRSALIASVVLHLMFPVGLLTMKVLEYFNIEIFPRTRKIHDVYQDFVQVDMVALPDIAIKDLDKVDVTSAVEDTVKDTKSEEDAMLMEAKRKQEEKTKRLAKEESEKKKALAKLEEEAKREAALKALAEGEGKRTRKKLKGNILSSGAAARGNLGTPKDRYDSLIQAKIKERFTILPNQTGRGLLAIVHIEIFPTGRVREKRLEKTSGDPMYDSSVLQAIDEAQPLPVPEDLQLLYGGITITFKADDNGPGAR